MQRTKKKRKLEQTNRKHRGEEDRREKKEHAGGWAGRRTGTASSSARSTSSGRRVDRTAAVQQGLDFTGSFLYAVNVRGPQTGTIGDATFTTDDATPGFSISAENEIVNWAPGIDFSADAAPWRRSTCTNSTCTLYNQCCSTCTCTCSWQTTTVLDLHVHVVLRRNYRHDRTYSYYSI